MIDIIRRGLRKSSVPKNIVVVGAGMAGLVAASLLKDAGHNVKIIEADSRIGGRVYTLRAPFTHGLYLDVGAMRIPESHYLVMEYIRKFNLPLQPFINETPNDIIYANGIKTKLSSYLHRPDVLHYPVAPYEKGKTAQQLLDMAVQPFLDVINQDPVRHRALTVKNLDRYSLYTFLKYFPHSFGAGLSEGAIEMIGVLLGLEGLMGQSFLGTMRFVMPLLRQRFYEIVGGNDLLPRAFLPKLQEDIMFQRRMTKIVQHSDGVTIQGIDEKSSDRYSISGDIAIVSIPFTVLRFVEVEPRHSFSHQKWKAIRELHYSSATKIGLEFKSRFWEKAGQYGGRTTTDLPIRFAYYPSHGIGKPGPAVLLASYTMGDDVVPWDGLSNKERIRYALMNLKAIHGDVVYREFVRGISYSWAQNPLTCGDWAMFNPGQQTELHPFIAMPEGRVHFAGEHTSLTHGWIQGAIESGIRVAVKVSDLPRSQ
ncbi:flavin monoamine oxidase family protein [Paenibacillus oleatilyticus]|uniref:flavin monoamine oxidase family protein n=1 Tax=Paenibacillus oleatilyticus TaxID=2594886 RepID=UPI001C200583|nr:flavin monoamine oxidase family protein [Paenibacillus oleatilyticus]MBU7320196.1 flavin monoamine oxidase family protein [Paenibacillus oleatilyticus]